MRESESESERERARARARERERERERERDQTRFHAGLWKRENLIVFLCLFVRLFTRLFACLFVCLFVCFPVYLSVEVSILLSTCLSIWLSVCLSFSVNSNFVQHLSIYEMSQFSVTVMMSASVLLPFFMTVFLFFRLFACLPVYLSVCLLTFQTHCSVRLFIYLFLCPFTDFLIHVSVSFPVSCLSVCLLDSRHVYLSLWLRVYLSIIFVSVQPPVRLSRPMLLGHKHSGQIERSQ